MKTDDLVRELNSLTVIEAVRLAKQLEREWGVSSAIRIQIFNPEKDVPSTEEKTEFDVVLLDCGPRKIDIIKILRSTMDLGLKEAKDMAETPNQTILRAVSKTVAYNLKYELERSGANVSVI